MNYKFSYEGNRCKASVVGMEPLKFPITIEFGDHTGYELVITEMGEKPTPLKESQKTDTQQTQSEICSNNYCDYCISKVNDMPCSVCKFRGRKLRSC